MRYFYSQTILHLAGSFEKKGKLGSSNNNVNLPPMQEAQRNSCCGGRDGNAKLLFDQQMRDIDSKHFKCYIA